jgi:TRAP transporter TAXI family solute receptor
MVIAMTDTRLNHFAAVAAALVCLFAAASPRAADAPAAAASTQAANNKGVVELETGSATGISVNIAEDLANIIDDGATRRVLPVIGKGALQNITDLRVLRGVDMAILQQDVLDNVRQQKTMAGVENLTYVTKLYNEEFHLLARPEIKSVADLANQKVNADIRGAGTAVTAGRLFDLLKVSVTITNFDQQTALQKLKKGEIAALAYVAGKPAPLFRGLKADDGLHFISIPLDPKVTAAYVPTRLTNADYPDLVGGDKPVDTVAVGAALFVANLVPESERYRNVVNFIDAFFTQFQSLLEPGHHPKWAEVNLTAEIPGWRRFGPADQWLKRNAPAVASQSNAPRDLKTVFQRFLEERLQVSGGQGMTQEQKDELFGQFQHWLTSQTR